MKDRFLLFSVLFLLSVAVGSAYAQKMVVGIRTEAGEIRNIEGFPVEIHDRGMQMKSNLDLVLVKYSSIIYIIYRGEKFRGDFGKQRIRHIYSTGADSIQPPDEVKPAQPEKVRPRRLFRRDHAGGPRSRNKDFRLVRSICGLAIAGWGTYDLF